MMSLERLAITDKMLDRLEVLVKQLEMATKKDVMETVEHINFVRLKMIYSYHQHDHQPEILAQIQKIDSIIKMALELHTKQDVTTM